MGPTPQEEGAPKILVSPEISREEIGGRGERVKCITPQVSKDLQGYLGNIAPPPLPF